MILDLQNIYKDYQQDKLVVPVLKDVSLQVEEGGICQEAGIRQELSV